ncbi:MAG: hypothetical protein H7Z75_12205 [Ferruginibacter sp.]|nr:hypothetical protein [Cytophagales bacterium]
MEEKTNPSKGFFDLAKWLVDREIADPFGATAYPEEIHQYPYEDGRSEGYIRYVIRGKQLIILDRLLVAFKS